MIYRGGGGGGGPDPLSLPLDPPMMLVIRVYLSVDESSSSVLYLFQVVDISVVVWLPGNVLVFKAWACHSDLSPLGVCAPLIPENNALISPNP